MCVKRAARSNVRISSTLAIGHVATAWRALHAHRQGFESRARTATDIFGVRRVSTIIKGEVEIRASMSESETDHVADPSILTENTNMASTFVRHAKRPER